MMEGTNDQVDEQRLQAASAVRRMHDMTHVNAYTYTRMHTTTCFLGVGEYGRVERYGTWYWSTRSGISAIGSIGHFSCSDTSLLPGTSIWEEESRQFNPYIVLLVYS